MLNNKTNKLLKLGKTAYYIQLNLCKPIKKKESANAKHNTFKVFCFFFKNEYRLNSCYGRERYCTFPYLS